MIAAVLANEIERVLVIETESDVENVTVCEGILYSNFGEPSFVLLVAACASLSHGV